MSELVFTKRQEKERYQVRFWSTPSEYEAFTSAVRSEGLVLQDVLNELMNWFTKNALEKKLKINNQTEFP